jgi:hypothetical protein
MSRPLVTLSTSRQTVHVDITQVTPTSRQADQVDITQLTPTSRQADQVDITQVTLTSRQADQVDRTPVTHSKHWHISLVPKIPPDEKRRKQSAQYLYHKKNTT